jgi:hypothetical protein
MLVCAVPDIDGCLFVAQIAGASDFSLDVATTVLRCFQLQPATANKELIAKTLLRCAAALLPSSCKQARQHCCCVVHSRDEGTSFLSSVGTISAAVL